MDSTYSGAVAAELRAAMGRAQVGVTDLAHLSGMTVKTVSRTLNGHRDISVEELVKLSQALHADAGTVIATATATHQTEAA